MPVYPVKGVPLDEEVFTVGMRGPILLVVSMPKLTVVESAPIAVLPGLDGSPDGAAAEP